MAQSTGFGFKKKMVVMKSIIAIVFLSVLLFSAISAVAQMHQEPQSPEQEQTSRPHPDTIKYGFLSAAIAVGLGSVGAGIAVGYVGSAAMGTIGEKPELATRALLFVGLAEGIAIYGLIISIMILGKL